MKGKFGSSLSKSGAHDLHNRALSSSFFFLSSYDLTDSLSLLLFGAIPVFL